MGAEWSRACIRRPLPHSLSFILQPPHACPARCPRSVCLSVCLSAYAQHRVVLADLEMSGPDSYLKLLVPPVAAPVHQSPASTLHKLLSVPTSPLLPASPVKSAKSTSSLLQALSWAAPFRGTYVRPYSRVRVEDQPPKIPSRESPRRSAIDLEGTVLHAQVPAELQDPLSKGRQSGQEPTSNPQRKGESARKRAYGVVHSHEQLHSGPSRPRRPKNRPGSRSAHRRPHPQTP